MRVPSLVRRTPHSHDALAVAQYQPQTGFSTHQCNLHHYPALRWTCDTCPLPTTGHSSPPDNTQGRGADVCSSAPALGSCVGSVSDKAWNRAGHNQPSGCSQPLHVPCLTPRSLALDVALALALPALYECRAVALLPSNTPLPLARFGHDGPSLDARASSGGKGATGEGSNHDCARIRCF